MHGERPSEGWCKLNTDGVASGNSGLVGCGGIVRDEHGGWLVGFSRQIGITTSFVAELWGLRDGLMMCNNLNRFALVVEVDYENNIVFLVLDDCKQLISRFSRIKFNHCYHQSNCCADVLAKVVVGQNFDYIYFECPPVDIRRVFEDDLDGVFLNRLCSETVVVLSFV